MSRYSDAAPTKWLNAEALKRMAPDGRWFTIASGREMLVSNGTDQERKAVLTFVDRDELWALNRINGSQLADVLGDEMDAWCEHKIFLIVEPVTFGNKRVAGIRIKQIDETEPEVPF
jgi:hypothetical protein